MKLYNTMTRKKEVFKPLEKSSVSLYVCGHTVYNEPHIGNWWAYVRWDILLRTLRANGYSVRHVQNITDVGHLTDDEDQGDDKLQKAATKQRKTAWEIAEYYIASTNKDANDLGLVKPSHSPRATDYIPQQIAMLETLESKGYTYEITDDGIYFDTSKLANYGELALLDIEGLKSGARIKNTKKKNITDFALWKFSPKNSQRDMEWDSPWGVGFPGWHLECSAMAKDLLGGTIDIHTGGIDHIAVHHTNEIAQSETANEATFANYWLHANHMKVGGAKMSKSLGNIYTLSNLRSRKFDMRAFKLLVATSHYRRESNFTWKLMNGAQSRLKRWQAVADMRWQTCSDAPSLAQKLEKSTTAALVSLNDDLDTPGALRALEDSFNSLEKQCLAQSDKKSLTKFLQFIDAQLGINLMLPDIANETKTLIERREKARQDQDFDKSDEIRNELSKKGITVKDTPHGAVWSRL